jgi:SAM-dependent methyltransferase
MSTDQRTIDWYNQNASEYASHLKDPKDSIFHTLYEKPAMYDQLPDLTDKDVLSLGCGSGEDSTYLKSKGASRSVGIDISQELISIAKDTHPDCEFDVMDMEQLGFASSTFDFAYSSLAIHYIEVWSEVFSEVYRVLKPGSYFLFSCGHPVYSALSKTEDTSERSVRQLSMVTDRKTETAKIVGSYLGRRRLGDALRTMGVTTWHKPISEIIDEASRVGFLVEKLIEPKPLEEMRGVSLKDFQKLSEVPYFMILKLLKPV